MANSKLLKEAIADAKAVKETALANAKIALEEAFTPRLQSILSKKLREEMEDEDEKETEMANEELSSSEIGTGTAKAPKEPSKLEAGTDLSVGIKKSSAAPGAEGEYKKVKDINEMDAAEEDEVDMETDENLSVAQLREKLLKRLAELDSAESEEEKTEAEEPAAETEEDPMADAYMGEDEPEADEDEDEDEGEDYDVTGEEEEDTEEDEDGLDLESIIRELEASVDAEEAPEAEAGEEEMQEDKLSSGEPAGTDKGEDPKVVMAEEEEEDKKEETDEVIDLEEILKEMEADLKEGEEEEKKEKEDMEEVKRQLKEAYETITSLRGTINEVNLLNAKLLFANKLFRAHNLTNEQKVKVIETLDRTKSVREVKLVYSTLAENLKFGSSQKVAKKSITEGIASKVVKSTKPAAAKQVIAEGADFSARFKKLAGIIR